MSKFTFKPIAVAVLATATVAPAIADDQGSHQWEATLMGGRNFFDNDRNLDDANSASLGFGYMLTDDLSLEGFYQDFNADSDPGSTSVDGRQLRLDALYHFGSWSGWRPFLLAGAGDQKFDVSAAGDDNETFANIGAGIKKKVANNWLVRADARSLYSFDENETDYSANLGLSYLWGGAKKAADKDSDGDGVFDSLDQCPNTPAGAPVDAKGCALDSDRDGVADYLDKCLNTPYGYAVNDEGCMLTRDKEVSFDLSLRFATNSAVVENYDVAEVEKVVSYIKAHPSAKVVIEGHTSSTGAAAYNQKLSERRAAAVRQLLIDSYGVDGARLSSVGYGEERPIADNSTAEGRAANRRVVAKVTDHTEESVSK